MTAPSAIALIHRVQGLVREHHDFFQAVREWYGNVNLARKVIRLMLHRRATNSRLTLTINGNLLAGESVTVTPQAQAVTWVLTPGALVVGENAITVCVEERPGGSLLARSAGTTRQGDRDQQLIELTRPEPDALPTFRLSGCSEAQVQQGCWEVRPFGHLTFRLRLGALEPVSFTLGLKADDGSWTGNLKDVLKDVLQRVRKRLQQLEEERRRTQRVDPARAARIEHDISDLMTYEGLHRVQIEPALESPDEATLRDVIRQTGDPDVLLSRFQPPPVAESVPPPMPIAQSAMPTSPPAPSRDREPLRPRRPVPHRRPQPRARGSSLLSGCLTVMVIGALAVGGLAYAGWTYLVPKPAVTIESPLEGQTVAAGAPLQVWVGGEDFLGVQSLTLEVDPASADLVQGKPTPERFTFGPDVTDTGSKVFTVNIAPRNPAEPRQLTLIATMTHRNGKTTQARRVVTVGGTQEDLGFEINPVDPKPTQPVAVIVRGVNLPPGSKITYRLKGTDGYMQNDTREVGPDGSIRFEVPGSFSGVEDVIEAEVEGTKVRRQVKYKF